MAGRVTVPKKLIYANAKIAKETISLIYEMDPRNLISLYVVYKGRFGVFLVLLRSADAHIIFIAVLLNQKAWCTL